MTKRDKFPFIIHYVKEEGILADLMYIWPKDMVQVTLTANIITSMDTEKMRSLKDKSIKKS